MEPYVFGRFVYRNWLNKGFFSNTPISSWFVSCRLRLQPTFFIIMRKISVLLILLLVCYQGISQHKTNWKHVYHHSLVMKMFLSVPDNKGGSLVAQDFQSALQIIKETDQLTLGVPKIIYLVGWQYNGHDDQYPAFFEVNPALKRPADPTARESLLWLMREAKQYNTTISLHINMTDAYENSPLWKDYLEKDMLSKNADGSLLVIGNYNNRKAYQINYRREWEEGYAKKRVDDLLKLVPALREAGTIHLDAWIARESKGHQESVVTEAGYQQKLADYWNAQGIDVTTEWVMDYMHNRVPYYWHFNGRSQQDYLRQPVANVTGTKINKDLNNSDIGLDFLFGISMHGENHFPDRRKKTDQSNWQQEFQQEFYLNFLQYDFLNRQQRLRVDGTGSNRVARFSDDVSSRLIDSTVVQRDQILRSGNTVCFPVSWRKDNSWAAYSTTATEWIMKLPETWNDNVDITVWIITKTGLKRKTGIKPSKRQLRFQINAGEPLLLVPEQSVASGGDTTFLRYQPVQKIGGHPAYHQTLVMKLFMSQALYEGKFKRRDNGRQEVFLTAEQTMEVIRKLDHQTAGIPKIVYLVGWQYNGHDSRYPAWFEGNEAIKRPGDANALESLRWIMLEARKYNTTVSLHINMFDAYEDSPLWETYLKHDIIARRKDGAPLGGEWGYPISYAQEWKTGYAQKRIDSLCKLLPVQEAKTIHIDAFHTWPPLPELMADGTWNINLDKKVTSPYLSFTVADETAAQKKIYAYWASKGIDVTSEGVQFLREEPFEQYQSMSWWYNEKDNYLKWPASTYTGGQDRSVWGKLFGSSLHGEETVRKDPHELNGLKEEFCLKTLIWYNLNRLERRFLVEKGDLKEVHFSNGVVTRSEGNAFSLTQSGILLADDDNVLMPALWIDESTLVAYSKTGYQNRTWTLPPAFLKFKKAILYTVTNAGQREKGKQAVRSGKLTINLHKDEMILIKLK